MCSIVGYVGNDLSANYVLQGLERLEYRGYDSAGFSCLDGKTKQNKCLKVAGNLSVLQEKIKKNPIDGFIGIGHTRWATHGVANEINAHPHTDCFGTISVVHNGIIENHAQLSLQLLDKKHLFHSTTDTEIIAHLFESCIESHKDLLQATSSLVNQLEGAYSILIISEKYPDHIIAIRKRSPLCIGITKNQNFISSDPISFAPYADEVLFLPDETFAVVSATDIQLYNFLGDAIPFTTEILDIPVNIDTKKGYQHFMLKEMYEQKQAIYDTVSYLQSKENFFLRDICVSIDQIKNLEHIIIIASGTSWHAAQLARYFFEFYLQVDVSVHLSSEFRYANFYPQKNSFYFVISQSGETADTLEAVRLLNFYTMPVICITNVATSTMAREADGIILLHAGVEIAVAATKTFVAQLAALCWTALYFAKKKLSITDLVYEKGIQELFLVGQQLEQSMDQYRYEVEHTIAKKYAQYNAAIFLGRNSSYVLAQEAALKLQEIAYIFSQAYPAGELKHGPLALIDSNVPVFIFSHQNQTIYQKTVSNAQEVKARGGIICSFLFEGQHELQNISNDFFVMPRTNNELLGSLQMIGLMQFLMYAIAKEKGCPIDKPRNLAKSVTVE